MAGGTEIRNHITVFLTISISLVVCSNKKDRFMATGPNSTRIHDPGQP